MGNFLLVLLPAVARAKPPPETASAGKYR